MDAEGLLHLLNAEPTLLPSAPVTATGDDIETRRRAGHSCLRCGATSQTAVIVKTEDHGNRWLDLCYEHFNQVRAIA